MKKIGRFSSGCLPWLVLVVAVFAISSIMLNNFVKRGEESAKKQIDSVGSQKKL